MYQYMHQRRPKPAVWTLSVTRSDSSTIAKTFKTLKSAREQADMQLLFHREPIVDMVIYRGTGSRPLAAVYTDYRKFITQ